MEVHPGFGDTAALVSRHRQHGFAVDLRDNTGGRSPPAGTGLTTLLPTVMNTSFVACRLAGKPASRAENRTGKDRVGSVADLSTASPLKLLVSRVVACDQAGRS